jgi:hypothetical protein
VADMVVEIGELTTKAVPPDGLVGMLVGSTVGAVVD